MATESYLERRGLWICGKELALMLPQAFPRMRDNPSRFVSQLEPSDFLPIVVKGKWLTPSYPSLPVGRYFTQLAVPPKLVNPHGSPVRKARPVWGAVSHG